MKHLDEDIHGSMARACASGKCGPRRPGDPPRNIEFVVLYPDGTFSDPAPPPEIQALAEATGGKTRARTRVDPGQK